LATGSPQMETGPARRTHRSNGEVAAAVSSDGAEKCPATNKCRMGDKGAMLGGVGQPTAIETIERLRQSWRHFAVTMCGTYSPLYAAICHSVADDPELLALTAAAPPNGQQPNVLLAAVHSLILAGITHPLAEIYAGRADPGPAPALFRDVCLAHRTEVGRLLATRHTQTNEPGRAALLALGLAVAADLVGEPIGLLDAGCSAGLNLLIDRYRFEYGPAGGLGPLDSPVTVTCALRGSRTVPARLPHIDARLGLDRSPVDISDTDDVRWLLACVWPDTGRLARTAAAIELARRHRPVVMSGDMVTDLDEALDRLDPGMPIIVVTTSACGCLSVEQRRAFRAVLERRAARQRLVWLNVDGPGIIDLIPPIASTVPLGSHASVLGLVSFETGTAVGRALALWHPHGAWMEWP
jgi:hypothetical protein